MNYFDTYLKNFNLDNYLFMATYFVPATILTLFLEFYFEKKNSTLSKLYSRKLPISIRQDIFIWIGEVLMIWPLIGTILTVGLPAFIAINLNAKLNEHPVFHFLGNIPSLPLQIFIALLLGDIVFYTLHRFFHSNRAGWQLHSYHHSASEMSVFTTTRDNPIVNPVWSIFLVMPSAIFGSVAITSWVTFLTILHSFLIHSKINQDWGFIGKYVIVSPVGHLVHHSLDIEHREKNFAFLFPIIDHIFGTYYKGDKKVDKIGIDEKISKSVINQIFKDALKALKILVKK